MRGKSGNCGNRQTAINNYVQYTFPEGLSWWHSVEIEWERQLKIGFEKIKKIVYIGIVVKSNGGNIFCEA